MDTMQVGRTWLRLKRPPSKSRGRHHRTNLRRAARLYRDAIGNFDDTSAFQEAYIGLEAMEPPLAKMVGLNPGTEEIQGECEGRA
jgi:hypothetical protein